MKVAAALIAVLLYSSLHAQEITNVQSLNPAGDFDNIHIKKLDTDDHSTSFVIWVKKGVKSHKHEIHSEVIYVVEGKGKMTIGEETFEIKEGDYFRIPPNTYHALEVTSEQAMKVVSVQAPEFFGKDRVFENEN